MQPNADYKQAQPQHALSTRILMSVVNISSSRVLPEADVEQLAQLAVTLSRRLTRVLPEDMAPSMDDALAQIAAAVRVERCQLLEFSECGTLERAHTVTAPGIARGGAEDEETAPAEAWLLERLARSEIVNISRPEDLPREVSASREAADQPGACCILGVPASLGGQVVCALVLDNSGYPKRWPALLVERLQLLSEILAASLQRARHESTLRANVAVIQTLNARLEADNVYLKEEIKNYHD